MSVYDDMRNDFAEALGEQKNEVTITRTTNTTDSLGGVTSTSDASYTINCIFQPIRDSDRDIHAMGLAEPGSRKAFFKHEYTSSDDSDISGTFTPHKGDVLTDHEGIKWVIKEIVQKTMYQNNIIFIKTVVRRLE